MFQFPLHRDPRCNCRPFLAVLFAKAFQFPLHRDPRCNRKKDKNYTINRKVSVPFTSGSSLQLSLDRVKAMLSASFSSLYIGILAATADLLVLDDLGAVSVPFTSGSSLQHWKQMGSLFGCRVSVPFTSGSSLQRRNYDCRTSPTKRFSSLYIGILAATEGTTNLAHDPSSFSSLYIGILAATRGYATEPPA